MVLAWQSALYDYNWLADRTHGFDRALVVVLAVAAIVRPAFLVPFVIVVRVVNEQFLFPFGTTAARNVDDLLLMALLVIAATHLLFVVTRPQSDLVRCPAAHRGVGSPLLHPRQGQAVDRLGVVW